MRIQTITIQLKLKDGQVPYTNSLEGNTTTGYHSLKMFFEEFGPPNYEVKSIESVVDGPGSKEEVNV